MDAAVVVLVDADGVAAAADAAAGELVDCELGDTVDTAACDGTTRFDEKLVAEAGNWTCCLDGPLLEFVVARGFVGGFTGAEGAGAKLGLAAGWPSASECDTRWRFSVFVDVCTMFFNSGEE